MSREKCHVMPVTCAGGGSLTGWPLDLFPFYSNMIDLMFQHRTGPDPGILRGGGGAGTSERQIRRNLH